MEPEEKQKIRERLKDFFRKGKYTRPKYCGICGKKSKTEVHHFQYSPEIYIFVCKNCHVELHDGFYKRKKVAMYLLGFKIKEFKSAYHAQKELNINQSSITKVCKGKRKLAGKCEWKYV